MKKILAIAIAFVLAVLPMAACAEDLGVQVIGGPEDVAAAVSLDDMQIGTAYKMDGYAVVVPKEFKSIECFAQFGESGEFGVTMANAYDGNVNSSFAPVYSYTESACRYCDWSYIDAAWMDSGETADFVWLLADVTNLQKTGVEFTEEAVVKVVYQDDYEFSGWVRQIVYDHMENQNGDRNVNRYGFNKETYPAEIVMNPAKVETVEMMYTGTYVFGCTLPNYVLEDKESPLRIEIQLGENDLTYNIRK